jgi:hypothetical protein
LRDDALPNNLPQTSEKKNTFFYVPFWHGMADGTAATSRAQLTRTYRRIAPEEKRSDHAFLFLGSKMQVPNGLNKTWATLKGKPSQPQVLKFI